MCPETHSGVVWVDFRGSFWTLFCRVFTLLPVAPGSTCQPNTSAGFSSQRLILEKPPETRPPSRGLHVRLRRQHRVARARVQCPRVSLQLAPWAWAWEQVPAVPAGRLAWCLAMAL